MKGYRDLIAWQKSFKLAIYIYRATERFPEEERFGLQSQMRRAAVSIPSNIAEGWGRRQGRDFVRFLMISRGSLFELETQILIATELGFMNHSQTLLDLTDEISRILAGLIKAQKLKLARKNRKID